MAAKLGLQIYEWVNKFARKLAAKPNAQGIMKIQNQETIRDLSNEILTKFMKYNIPKEAIKSENDVKVIFNQIIGMENQTFTKNLKKTLTPKKSADVLDLTGKKIDTSKPILGGKNVPETEAQVKSRLEGMNKKTVERIRRRRFEAAQKAEREKMAKDPEYIPEILDPDDFAGGGLAPMLGEPTYADGGRTGFKKGTKFDPKRRGFLKLAAGLASIPIIGKYFKWAKPLAKASKTLTSVPIKNIKGMPPWFKLAVNRAIKQGEEISSHGDRIITHVDTLPNSKTKIYVEQDLNTGNVVMDIGEGKHGWNQGHLGQPVRLEYKASEVIEPTINKQGKVTNKGTKTKEEFNVEEAEFSGGHPENVKFEESTLQKYGEHGSDFSEVEKYARGKNTVIVKGKETTHHPKTKKAERTEYESNKAEADAERWTDEVAEGPDDYASGGRVPFVKGKLAKYATPEGLAKLIEKLFPGTTKLGQTSRPMAPKTELKRAIAGFQEREAAAKLKIWEDPKKVRAAVDDIFPTGDYKMDAEMAAEALVENNPAAFGGKLIDDIDDATRSDIYGAVLEVVQSDFAKTLQLKRLSKPTKTLEGIKKTGKINISDPNVADEFSRFMKETDPKGFKDIEQKIQIESFDPKGRKKNASGGRVSLSAGGLAGMLGE